MIVGSFDRLPEFLQKEPVRPYYEALKSRRAQLVLKRLFDIFLSGILLILLSPIFLVLALLIRLDSQGPVFYRQTRVTMLGKRFRIFKFRTMVQDAEKIGTSVTVSGDSRITRIGHFIRKYRIDELPQLIDVFRGCMSFVGTRPEVEKYVKEYTDEMNATLLLPAGVTSTASIRYKDEAELLDASNDPDRTYIHDILPQKMKYNLDDILKFSLGHDLAILFETVRVVLFKGNSET